MALKVEKREYFCIVKQLKGILRITLVTIMLSILSIETRVHAQNNPEQTDSVEISLLTCSPYKEIYSLYGHTAIRYKNLRTNEDWVFNYGVFNFKKPFFIIRFTLGFTDYELGFIPFDVFKREYYKRGSKVTEQVLNINPEEKARIINSLDENYLPENRVYRYNFFYNNCTTKARDLIEDCIDGEISYEQKKHDSKGPSFRNIIHLYTKNHSWAAFGNDLCLGIGADCGTTLRERQFVPYNLMLDFDNAYIISHGGKRKLVKANRTLVTPQELIIEKGFPLSPTQCAYILLTASLIILLIEYKKATIYKTWDVILMSATGLAGIIIFILFFSKHPTTSTNLQILLLNPLPLFFIPTIIRGKRTIYWKISIVTSALFILGSLIQDYAEGMELIALCLLSRSWIHLRIDTKQKTLQ